MWLLLIFLNCVKNIIFPMMEWFVGKWEEGESCENVKF